MTKSDLKLTATLRFRQVDVRYSYALCYWECHPCVCTIEFP